MGAPDHLRTSNGSEIATVEAIDGIAEKKDLALRQATAALPRRHRAPCAISVLG